MRVHALIASTLSMALVALLGGHCQAQQVKQGTRNHAEEMVIDQQTRRLAESIHASEVAQLRVYGVQFDHFSNDPIVVKNKRTISTLLAALRHAYNRPLGLANRIDTLEIHFKPHQHHTREFISLNFNLTNAPDCYGPEFQSAMNALLLKSNKMKSHEKSNKRK